MVTELELRAQLKQVEAEMAEIGVRVKRIDEVLNQAPAARAEVGWKAAVEEYLAWLDRVEALGLAYVNANIVTQRLRLVYEDPPRGRARAPEPSHRMKEVKALLDAVRHTEQSDILLLRARRHSIMADVQRLSKDRKSPRGVPPRVPGRGGALTIGWLPLVVLLLALLGCGVLLDAFRPEIAHFVRSHLGVPDAPQERAP